MKYIVALDQGTTSSRAVVFDQQGRKIASHNNEFPQYYPHPGWVEHDPEDIYSSQIDALRQAVSKAGILPREPRKGFYKLYTDHAVSAMTGAGLE